MLDKLYNVSPSSLVRSMKIRLRKLSGQHQTWPNFLIIGTQKGGTTSLYDNLVKHPQVLPALVKEIHYFNHHYSNAIVDTGFYSLNWYQAHFPTQQQLEQHTAITGEATPSYLLEMRLPAFLARVTPDIKLIVLLRNPISRAYSHYQMAKRNKWLDTAFETLVEQEIADIQSKPFESVVHDYFQTNRIAYPSFVLRGIYVAQLKIWLEHFPREQFLILKSEDYFSNPEQTLQEITSFLKISEWRYGYQKTMMDGYNYSLINEEVRERLKLFFEPYNKQLYDLLNCDYEWS